MADLLHLFPSEELIATTAGAEMLMMGCKPMVEISG